MSGFSTDSSINSELTSHYQLNSHLLPSLSSLRPGMFTDDFSIESESERSQDSVTKRRRHGVYFHRPPVWCPGPCPHNNQPTAMRGCSISCMVLKGGACDDPDCAERANQQKWLLCPSCTRDVRKYTDRHIPRDLLEGSMGEEESNPWAKDLFCEMTAATLDAQVDAETGVCDSTSDDPLIVGSLNSHLTASKQNSKYQRMKVQSALATEPVMDSFEYHSSAENVPITPCLHYYRQIKPGLCTRLQLYKDVRLGVGEKWAIQEGSLVVCIGPSYIHLDRKEGFSDEFELTTGDFYIVCRLYADLWALCAKVSFDSIAGSYPHDAAPSGSPTLGFLPLCAVTLAANFGGFVKRCFRYKSFHPKEVRHPGNGLPVIPPERSHSVNASKQIFQGDKPRLELPSLSHGGCNSLSLEGIDMDYIPLDSTLHQLFSKFERRRERVHQLRSRMSLRNLWYGMKPSEQHLEMGSPIFVPTNSVALDSCQTQSSSLQIYDGQRRSHRHMGSSSSISQGWRWLTGTSTREDVTGEKRNMRSFIFSGSERLRSGFRSNFEL